MGTMHRSAVLLAATLLCVSCGGGTAGLDTYDLPEYLADIAVNPQRAETAYIYADVHVGSCKEGRTALSRNLVMVDEVEEVLRQTLSGIAWRPVTRIIRVPASAANQVSSDTLDGSLDPGCRRCQTGLRYTQLLEERFGNHMRHRLGLGGYSKLRHRVHGTLARGCEPAVRDTVFFYLALVATEQTEEDAMTIIRLERLLYLLAFAIPVGEKAGEPGAWYVKELNR